MAKINILEPNVFNKIAAGEVVERPASVIKELVENSIDAGAKNIDIIVENGGISLMRVIDDGCGIEESEVEKAFLSHATSKIKNVSDLDDIATLGFRGEALASIASVSELKMTTRTKDQSFATLIKVAGGEVFEKTQVGAPVGTNIEVRNLFYNIPVRYKFLKKPKQEENAISEIVSRLILANPTIAFKYSVDDKIVFQSTGRSPEDAIYSVYGANTLKNLIPISNVIGEMEINGFICKPTASKPNSTYQTVVINGRYVTCKLISTAIARVYEDYLMTRSYPLYILYINLPYEDIDVNVHPNKLEVRFKDHQAIFASINHTVDAALMEYRNTNAKDGEDFRTSADSLYNYSTTTSKTYSELLNTMIDQNKNATKVEQTNGTSLSEIILNEPKHSVIAEMDINEDLKQKLENIQSENQKAENPQPVLQQFLFDGMSKHFGLLSVKVVGKIFNTFIIVEVEDKVYIIDQHAAHERLLYDQLVLNLKHKEKVSQPLLIPFVLETNNKEHQFLIDNMENLKELGFELEEFGNNSFKVSCVPYNLPNIQIGTFLNEVLKDMDTILNLKTKDMILDKLAQTACKHAVKGGDDLTQEEIITLLENIARTEPQLQCPHGRPFVVELKRYEIDKWFKRVL